MAVRALPKKSYTEVSDAKDAAFELLEAFFASGPDADDAFMLTVITTDQAAGYVLAARMTYDPFAGVADADPEDADTGVDLPGFEELAGDDLPF